MRDCSESAAPTQTRLLEGRYQVLRAPDDSKIVRRRFVGWREIQYDLDRAFAVACNRDRHHQAQPRDVLPDNKNRGCSDQLDAAGGICSSRNYDFSSDATEFSHNRSRLYGGSERGSQNNSLFRNLIYEIANRLAKRNESLTPILSPQTGRGGFARSSSDASVASVKRLPVLAKGED